MRTKENRRNIWDIQLAGYKKTSLIAVWASGIVQIFELHRYSELIPSTASYILLPYCTRKKGYNPENNPLEGGAVTRNSRKNWFGWTPQIICQKSYSLTPGKLKTS